MYFHNLQPSHGLLGLVHFLFDIANAQFDLDFSRNDCALISGAAIQHYYYDPNLNNNTTNQNWSKHCGFFNSFGAFDSLKYFTNLDIRDFHNLRPSEFDQLIDFELSQNRPLLALVDSHTLLPAVIWRDDDSFISFVSDDTVVTQPFDIHNLQLDNFLVVIRGHSSQPPSLGRDGQRKALLSWAVKHANRPYEFLSESDEAYCCGFHSWEKMLRDIDSFNLPPLYLRHHLRVLIEARRALASALEEWGCRGATFRKVAQEIEDQNYYDAYLTEKLAFSELAADASNL